MNQNAIFGETPAYGSVEWWTPPELFQALGESFDLDPCGPPGGVPWLPASRTYALPESDGRLVPWEGFVWMNPPYGQHLARFVGRFIAHRCGIALVPARTDQSAIQRLLAEADRVFFLRRRLHFRMGPLGLTAPRSPAFPSLLAALGTRGSSALDRCPLEGVRMGRTYP